MPDDELLATLAEAQRAPSDDYMIWARISSRGRIIEIPLETMRLPLSLEMDAMRDWVERRARERLAAIGFEDEEIGSAQYFADPLPSAEDLEALLEAEIRSGSRLMLVDLVHWEALRIRLRLTPTPSEIGNDLELTYKGLSIRQSAAG